jgi:anti-sigma factor RsiW
VELGPARAKAAPVVRASQVKVEVRVEGSREAEVVVGLGNNPVQASR